MATKKAPAKKAAPKKKPAAKAATQAAPAAAAPKAKRKAADWERIEVDYRTGGKSVRELAAEHGISHVAILKKAKENDWTRDLSAKVKAKADALVTRATVTAEVTAAAKVTEQKTVEVEAQVQARIRLEHRKDIGRGRSLVMKLLGELEAQTDSPDLFEQLGELLIEPEQEEDSEAKKERQRKLREAYNRVLSLPGRADTVKKLADSLRILVDKEREAYGIESKASGDPNGLPVVTFKDFTGRKA